MPIPYRLTTARGGEGGLKRLLFFFRLSLLRILLNLPRIFFRPFGNRLGLVRPRWSPPHIGHQQPENLLKDLLVVGHADHL
jgi:hypothetical protein